MVRKGSTLTIDPVTQDNAPVRYLPQSEYETLSKETLRIASFRVRVAVKGDDLFKGALFLQWRLWKNFFDDQEEFLAPNRLYTQEELPASSVFLPGQQEPSPKQKILPDVVARDHPAACRFRK